MAFGTLSIIYPDGRRERVELTKATTRIGSAAENDVVVRDPYVAAYHAQILSNERGIQALDLGSSTGTLLMDQRLKPQVPQPLSPNATLRLGNVMLRFEASTVVVRPPQTPLAPVRKPSQPQLSSGNEWNPRSADPTPARVLTRRRPWFQRLGWPLIVVGITTLVVLLGLSAWQLITRSAGNGGGGNGIGAQPTISDERDERGCPITNTGLTNTYVVTASDGLHVRVAAGSTNQSIGFLRPRELVEVVGGPVQVADGGLWVHVRNDQVDGWSNQRYLSQC